MCTIKQGPKDAHVCPWPLDKRDGCGRVCVCVCAFEPPCLAYKQLACVRTNPMFDCLPFGFASFYSTTSKLLAFCSGSNPGQGINALNIHPHPVSFATCWRSAWVRDYWGPPFGYFKDCQNRIQHVSPPPPILRSTAGGLETSRAWQ